MTSFQLRTDPGQRDAGADFLLDWFDDKSSSTVSFDPSFLRNCAPGPIAEDLLRVAGAVFCADKVALRSLSEDAWTRELLLTIPVSDVDRWRGVAVHLQRTLSFLSGDRWTTSFTALSSPASTTAVQTSLEELDAVCLFSGGLDSLAGAVDLLAAGKRVVFVGHHDSSKSVNRQTALHPKLADYFGDRVTEPRWLYLRPHLAQAGPSRPLPDGRDEVEITTRSRSFLFLAAAVAIADSQGPGVPVYMPENGFIGINVPLSSSRAGSLSTRTTHPLYMAHMAELLTNLGLNHDIINPFRLHTKGELLDASADGRLVAELAPETVSCSHPEAVRWQGGVEASRQDNCGTCFPCLIRRASLHAIGVDDADEYGVDVFKTPALLDPNLTRVRGASLRAVLDNLRRPDPPVARVLANGRIPGAEAPLFHGVHLRGREELRRWLSSGTDPLL